MAHASAEYQPSTAIAGQLYDLMCNSGVLILRVHALLQFLLDKLAAALMDTGHIVPGMCRARYQRRQIPSVNQFSNRHWLDQVRKKRLTVGNFPVTETKRCGG